jgi:hypothetical protein
LKIENYPPAETCATAKALGGTRSAKAGKCNPQIIKIAVFAFTIGNQKI